MLDKESFSSFAENIYIETYKKAAAVVYSLCGGDEALRKIYGKEKDSKFFLIILNINMYNNYAVKSLYEIYLKTKKYEIKETVLDSLNEISEKEGLSIDDLCLKYRANFGFDARGEKVIDNNYKLILNNDCSVNVFDIKNNKVLKSVPKDLSKSIKDEIKYLKKEIQNIIKKLSINLTTLLIYEKKYHYSFFKEVFIDNPIMNKFSSSLVWNLYDKDNNFITLFRYTNDGSYSNADDEEIQINKDGFISLASPAEMDEETISKWKQQLEDYEISQTINQLPVIKLDKNNLINEIAKLQNAEIAYGTFKSFGARYSMIASYIGCSIIGDYYLELDNGDYFNISINTDEYVDYRDKVKINIKFSNTDNKKASDRFVYGLLMLMIWDFRLTELF